MVVSSRCDSSYLIWCIFSVRRISALSVRLNHIATLVRIYSDRQHLMKRLASLSNQLTPLVKPSAPSGPPSQSLHCSRGAVVQNRANWKGNPFLYSLFSLFRYRGSFTVYRIDSSSTSWLFFDRKFRRSLVKVCMNAYMLNHFQILTTDESSEPERTEYEEMWTPDVFRQPPHS